MSDQIKDLEDAIKEQRKNVDLNESLERLLNNRDFKKVIHEGYFKEEAIRLVHLLGDPGWQTEQQQKSLHDQMNAVANLAQYFRTIGFFSDRAVRTIAECEETIQELAREDLSNG